MRSRGFTLMEVMIALAVFAIVSVSLLRNATMTVHQTLSLQEKTIAWWVAENEMSELRSVERLPENYPAVSTKRKSVTMADMDWRVVTRFVSTEDENIRRVEIEVFHEDNEGPALAAIAGFLGRH